VKTLLRCGSTVAIVVLLTAASSPAEEGWKLPLWKPFGSAGKPAVRNAGGTGSSVLGQAASAVSTGSKKAWNTTVDVVTLKPVRQHFAPKPKSNLGLGFKPDPRKKPASSSGWLGSWFKPKPKQGPQTVEEFFSMERPK
jgi:hypothetical protein